jgi:hypothetical protein
VNLHLSNDVLTQLGFHPPGVVTVDVPARTTEGVIATDDMFELHPPGTVIRFKGDMFTVGEDGLWRNEEGMIPAGQTLPPPEPSRHCKGCRCGEPKPPSGRMQHGGS